MRGLRRRRRGRRSPCQCAAPCATASHCSARSKSAGVVSLSSDGIAGDCRDVHSCSAQDRSLVGWGGASSRQRRRCATRPAGTPEEFGPARARCGRLGRLADPSRARRYRRSVRQAPHPRRTRVRAMRRSTTAGGQKGRAASWMRTASPFDRGQAGADGVRALRSPPSINGPTSRPASASAASACCPAAMTTTRAADRGVSDQAFDRPAKHRLAAEQPILLGQPAAEALAFAGGDDEGGGSHGRRL